jgi:hypothetical protein
MQLPACLRTPIIGADYLGADYLGADYLSADYLGCLTISISVRL